MKHIAAFIVPLFIVGIVGLSGCSADQLVSATDAETVSSFNKDENNHNKDENNHNKNENNHNKDENNHNN